MQMLSAEKQALRKALLLRREAIPDKAEKSAQIIGRLEAMQAYRQAENLFCYVSMPGEVETHQLLEAALASGKRVFVPHCPPGNAPMAFYRMDALASLKTSRFGVLEPDPLSCAPAGNQKGICVVPGIAFDAKGYRLGYGRGYYDRFLTQNPMCSVGLCFAELFLHTLPVSPWDKPVHTLLTQEEEITFHHATTAN